jgi:hypothetical protein
MSEVRWAAAGSARRHESDAYDRRERPLVCPYGSELSVSQVISITRGAFAGFDGRVFIGIGGLSHPMWQAQAAGLATAFPVSRPEIFEERHHVGSSPGVRDRQVRRARSEVRLILDGGSEAADRGGGGPVARETQRLCHASSR